MRFDPSLRFRGRPSVFLVVLFSHSAPHVSSVLSPSLSPPKPKEKRRDGTPKGSRSMERSRWMDGWSRWGWTGPGGNIDQHRILSRFLRGGGGKGTHPSPHLLARAAEAQAENVWSGRGGVEFAPPDHVNNPFARRSVSVCGGGEQGGAEQGHPPMPRRNVRSRSVRNLRRQARTGRNEREKETPTWVTRGGVTAPGAGKGGRAGQGIDQE